MSKRFEPQCFLTVLTAPASEGCCEEYKVSVKHLSIVLQILHKYLPPLPPLSSASFYSSSSFRYYY